MNQEPFESESSINISQFFDIAGVWRQQRARFVLLAATGLFFASSTVIAFIALRPTYEEGRITVGLRRFKGLEKGLYPNGEQFSPNDLLTTTVLDPIYRRDGLWRYFSFDRFRTSFSIIDDNPPLDRVRREFNSRLELKTLTVAERAKLEEEYEKRAQEVSSVGFTLAAKLDDGIHYWPETLTGKVISDILTLWAEQARNKGVFSFTLNTYSPDSLPKPPFDDDYPVLLDRLHLAVDRVTATIRDFNEVPGARLFRVGDRHISLGELEIELQDDLKFELRLIEAPILTVGLYRYPAVSVTYMQDQIFHIQSEEQESRSRAAAIDRVMDRYTASRPGSIHGQNSRTNRTGTLLPGESLAPSIGDSFLEQVVGLASQSADTQFRQELTRQSLDIGMRLAELETDRQIHERMLNFIDQQKKIDAIPAEEHQKWQRFVDEQILKFLTELKQTMSDLQLLNDAVSIRSLQPSRAFGIITPLVQTKITPVSLKTISATAVTVYLIYLGLCILSLTLSRRSAVTLKLPYRSSQHRDV